MVKNPCKVFRLKVIKPIYQTLVVAEEARHWFTPEAQFNCAARVAELFTSLTKETKESFICCHLDNKNRLLCIETVSTGSLTASIVHPREVFKSVLLSSAAEVLFVHNHPSGDPEPSREDLEITQRLKEGGDLLGIRVLDHIIVGHNGRYVSLSDRGVL